jgi:uncharacterized membrane protein
MAFNETFETPWRLIRIRWQGNRNMAIDNPKSTARFAGHPIHPALVSYPIAFLTATLVTDLIYWQSREPFWATASFYLLLAGIVMALAAALAGFTDFLGDRRIRALSHAWQHMIGNLLAVLLSIFNLFVRLGNPDEAILSLGLWISAAVVLLLVFTGWRGGDLVFRHRVGVADSDTEIL